MLSDSVGGFALRAYQIIAIQRPDGDPFMPAGQAFGVTGAPLVTHPSPPVAFAMAALA